MSNELGAGRPRAACLAVCVVMFMVATEGIIAGSIMIFTRKIWGSFYSSEERVVKYVGEMLLLIAVSHFFDGIQSVLSGLLQEISFPHFFHAYKRISYCNWLC